MYKLIILFLCFSCFGEYQAFYKSVRARDSLKCDSIRNGFVKADANGKFYSDTGTIDMDSINIRALRVTELAHIQRGKLDSILTIHGIDNGFVPDSGDIDFYATPDDGFIVLETMTDLGVKTRVNEHIFRIARNTSGASIAAGRAVQYTGSTGNKPNFGLAKANKLDSMAAVGITIAAVPNNNFGVILLIGRYIGKTDYAGWTEGDELWVSDIVAGELIDSVPVAPSIVQWIGTIEIVDATNGAILVNVQAMTGVEKGTISNMFSMGDGLAGNKTLIFNGTLDDTVVWNGITLDLGKSISADTIHGTVDSAILNKEWFTSGNNIYNKNTGNVQISGAGVAVNNPQLILTSIPSGGGIFLNGSGDKWIQFNTAAQVGQAAFGFNNTTDNFEVDVNNSGWTMPLAINRTTGYMGLYGKAVPAFPFDLGGDYLRLSRIGLALVFGHTGNDYDQIGFNARPTSVNGVNTYVLSDYSSVLKFPNGGFQFYTGPSGTAGNNITLTNRFDIANNGNISIPALSAGGTVKANVTTGTLVIGIPDSALAADRARKLTVARTIGGTSFDGTANIVPDSATKAHQIYGGHAIPDSINCHGFIARMDGRLIIPYRTYWGQFDVAGIVTDVNVNGNSRTLQIEYGSSRMDEGVRIYNTDAAKTMAFFMGSGKMAVDTIFADSDITVSHGIHSFGGALIEKNITSFGNILLTAEGCSLTFKPYSEAGPFSSIDFNASLKLKFPNNIFYQFASDQLKIKGDNDNLYVGDNGIYGIGLMTDSGNITFTAADSVVCENPIKVNNKFILNGKLNISVKYCDFTDSSAAVVLDTFDMDDETNSLFYVAHDEDGQAIYISNGSDGDVVEIYNASSTNILQVNVIGAGDGAAIGAYAANIWRKLPTLGWINWNYQ